MKRSKVAVLLITSLFPLLLVIAALLPHRLLLLYDDLCINGMNSDDAHAAPPTSFHILDVILWKFVLRLLGEKSRDYCHTQQDCVNNAQKPSLHPVCQSYREFRSTIHFQQVCIPWNWYYSCRFHLRRVSIRSSSASVNRIYLVDRSLDHASCISLHLVDDIANQSAQLPPAVYIESMAIHFQSWMKPIVSVDAKGIEVNVVVQKGGLTIPKPIQNVNRDDDEHPGLSLQIGDMAIQEAMRYMPKPPEEEGIFPMIGLINITNLSLNAIEFKGKRAQNTLHTLANLYIPDEIFQPLANLTTGKFK